MRSLLSIIFLFWLTSSFAQNTTLVSGKIINEQGQSLEGVNVRLLSTIVSTVSNQEGIYSLKANIKTKLLKVSYSLAGYFPQTVYITADKALITFNVILIKDLNQLDPITITADKSRSANFFTIDQGLIKSFPGVSGNFESILKTLPGVSANNELSSQYSVRGGNFDGNLIYINDVEIFRPSLVRNGQQEGLSFINSELVSLANFSAGGFEARYGDKLSSVLDVRYNRPDSTEVITSAGMLRISATAKVLLNKSYLLAGFRNKTNQNILRRQPVLGSYQPKFYDFQTLYNIDINKKTSISFFGDYNLNRFTLIPKTRETTFGTIDQQYRLKIDYEGAERDNYQSGLAALTLAFKPKQNSGIKWISSVFQNREEETFDLEGSYIFDELETNYTGFENVRAGRGIGTNYQHARNELNAFIYSSELKGYKKVGASFWESGLRYEYDRITDRLNEYQLIDSAGYSIPDSPTSLVLSDVINSGNGITTNRITAYIQNTFNLGANFMISAGLRSNYNSYTNQVILSPRLNAVYKPTNKSFQYRFAAGAYDQPPFYRELRNFNGSLNPNTRAQRSIHILAASDYSFQGLNSRLKLTSELYFERFNKLIPYKIENLRIRYFADQVSRGYAAGADLSLSGELIDGLASTFRISFLKTGEDILNDSYQEHSDDGSISTKYPGYLKRPTDQRINFSTFFQDKLFNSPSYKVHLNILYGSALPTGPPQTERYRDIFKIPAYKRVDIGFSKDLLEGGSATKVGFLHKYFHSFVAYAEIFNLLNINNTVSFLWIKDINNNQFAVPNYLTSRQLNLKFIAKIKN